MEPELEDVEVTLPTPKPIMLDGVSIMETEDGGVEIDLEPEEEDEEETVDPSIHGANLADHVDDDTLNAIASLLLEGVEQDKQSRSEWEETLAKGIELMGLRIEERTIPFEGACGVFDPLMAEAVVRWQSTAMSELFPAKGPVKAQVIGIPNMALEDQASRVEQWMNLYSHRLQHRVSAGIWQRHEHVLQRLAAGINFLELTRSHREVVVFEPNTLRAHTAGEVLQRRGIDQVTLAHCRSQRAVAQQVRVPDAIETKTGHEAVVDQARFA